MTSKISKEVVVDYLKADVATLNGGSSYLLLNKPAITISTVNGSRSTAAATAGGASGSITVYSGDGGVQAIASATGNAGDSGRIHLYSGDGGDASGTGSTGNGGDGGNVLFSPGTGGTSVGGTAGVNGVIKLVQNPPFIFTTDETVVAVTGATTLTVANCRCGIYRMTGTAGATTLTTPTGAQLEAAFPSLSTGDSFELYVHNGNNGNMTVTAGATGMTVYGTAAITPDESAYLFFRRSAANTFECIVTLSA